MRVVALVVALLVGSSSTVHAEIGDGPVNGPAAAYVPAVRLDPPPPPPPIPVLWTDDAAGGRCVGLEFLLAHFSPGWSVERMSRIAYRESRCTPAADNPSSSATGVLQILSSHCPWLARTMGEPCSAGRLADPAYNIRAGAVLWLEQGYSAWAATS